MEEKLLILKLLEDGKITKEEAFSLLEAINGNCKKEKKAEKKAAKEDCAFEEDLNSFAKSVEKFANEVNAKVASTYREYEPKVKKSTKTAVDKASELLNNLSKNLESDRDDEIKAKEEEVKEVDFIIIEEDTEDKE